MTSSVARSWEEFQRTESELRDLIKRRGPDSLTRLIQHAVANLSSTESDIRGAVWDLIEQGELELTWDRKVKLP